MFVIKTVYIFIIYVGAVLTAAYAQRIPVKPFETN